MALDLRRLRDSLWLPYLATLASALPLAALLAAQNPMPEGACSGIGFGCSLYSWDMAGFALMILGVPYAVILGIVVGVLALLPPRFRPFARGAAWTGLAIPWVAVLFFGTAA